MPIPLKLTVYKGSDLLGEHRFDRDIVKIGRLASAHLKLDDTKVSRIHAVIEATGDGQGYSIIDMGSTEGTFVNGEKVSKERLKDGDEIRLGDCRLVVSLDDAEVRVPARDVSAPERATGASASRADGRDGVSTSISGAPPRVPSGLPPAIPPVDPREVWPTSTADMLAAGATQSLSPMGPTGSTGQPPSMDLQRSPVGPSASAGSFVVGAVSAVPSGPPPEVPSLVPAGISGLPASVSVGGGAAGRVPAMPMPGISGISGVPPGAGVPLRAMSLSPWGSVPSNLASDGVPENERALEVKTIWGKSTVLETLNVTDQQEVTMGDERKVSGWGPFQQVVRCDIEVPSKGLPAQTFVFATLQSQTGTTYAINVPTSFNGRVERADGTMSTFEELLKSGRAERGDQAGVNRYTLNAAETLYLQHHDLTFQVRYIRRQRFLQPGFLEQLNYGWVNMLILAFFIHALAVVSFLATPATSAELSESLFKNPNRFAQFRLTPEEKKKQSDYLAKLKDSAAGAKAKNSEGKAGKKDYPKEKKQGRMAVKGDPNDKEIAKSTLQKLFGAKGNTGRSYLFGSGGLGGELKGALGGVTGAEVGDASGLGGLGTRGAGPGGGGLSMNSVGLGALGTAGRGGGQSGYGEGVGGLGRKADRDIQISQGNPLIMGSLDKEIIRKVIKEHLAQIRYCYEKELTRSPGLFGKVATEFVISGQGNVQSASVTDSTMKNTEVEQCITAKIRTWIFPKPKGGGVVVVKYPFIFKTTG